MGRAHPSRLARLDRDRGDEADHRRAVRRIRGLRLGLGTDLENPSDFAFERLERANSCQATDEPPVSKEEQGWNAGDLPSLREARVSFDVYLPKGHPIHEAFGDVLHDRREGPAGSAPAGPQVKDDPVVPVDELRGRKARENSRSPPGPWGQRGRRFSRIGVRRAPEPSSQKTDSPRPDPARCPILTLLVGCGVHGFSSSARRRRP
jgi:hypothetical protein